MYDRLLESVRLIEHGVPDERVGLSRRRRFQSIAVDVDGDIAVTGFLFRAHGGAQWDNTVLERRNGEWRMLGGGGACCYDYDELLRSPTCASLGGVHLRSEGSGGTARDRPPGHQGWLSYAELELCEHVDSVVLEDSRRIAVPWHHRAIVIWPGAVGPGVTVLDASGTDIGTFSLPGGE